MKGVALITIIAIIVLIWFVKAMLCEHEYREVVKKYYPNGYKKYSLFPITLFPSLIITEKEIIDTRAKLIRKIAFLGGWLASALFALGIASQLIDRYL